MDIFLTMPGIDTLAAARLLVEKFGYLPQTARWALSRGRC
jgi:hypothetical protein